MFIVQIFAAEGRQALMVMTSAGRPIEVGALSARIIS